MPNASLARSFAVPIQAEVTVNIGRYGHAYLKQIEAILAQKDRRDHNESLDQSGAWPFLRSAWR